MFVPVPSAALLTTPGSGQKEKKKTKAEEANAVKNALVKESMAKVDRWMLGGGEKYRVHLSSAALAKVPFKVRPLNSKQVDHYVDLFKEKGFDEHHSAIILFVVGRGGFRCLATNMEEPANVVPKKSEAVQDLEKLLTNGECMVLCGNHRTAALKQLHAAKVEEARRAGKKGVVEKTYPVMVIVAPNRNAETVKALYVYGASSNEIASAVYTPNDYQLLKSLHEMVDQQLRDAGVDTSDVEAVYSYLNDKEGNPNSGRPKFRRNLMRDYYGDLNGKTANDGSFTNLFALACFFGREWLLLETLVDKEEDKIVGKTGGNTKASKTILPAIYPINQFPPHIRAEVLKMAVEGTKDVKDLGDTARSLERVNQYQYMLTLMCECDSWDELVSKYAPLSDSSIIASSKYTFSRNFENFWMLDQNARVEPVKVASKHSDGEFMDVGELLEEKAGKGRPNKLKKVPATLHLLKYKMSQMSTERKQKLIESTIPSSVQEMYARMKANDGKLPDAGQVSISIKCWNECTVYV